MSGKQVTISLESNGPSYTLMMKERNFGYAKFASKESADAAIEGLHGHEVLGMKLKVMHADPPKTESSRKRPRT